MSALCWLLVMMRNVHVMMMWRNNQGRLTVTVWGNTERQCVHIFCCTKQLHIISCFRGRPTCVMQHIFYLPHPLQRIFFLQSASRRELTRLFGGNKEKGQCRPSVEELADVLNGMSRAHSLNVLPASALLQWWKGEACGTHLLRDESLQFGHAEQC